MKQTRSAREGEVVGFIGLGNMGIPMARRLVNSGFRVCGFDLSARAREAARSQRLQVAESLDEGVAEASLIVLMLPDSSAVESVLAEPAVRGRLEGGVTVVDMGSSDPIRTTQLAARLVEFGAKLVDAPVSGGVIGAEEGRLTIMAGGDHEELDRLEHLFAAMGTVKRTGPVGSGHAVKALNNLLSAASLLASSEAILAGERFGVSPEVLLGVVNASSGRSFSTEFKWPRFILPRTFDSGFSLQLMLKDAQLAVDLARHVGLEARLGESVVSLWCQAAEVLPGADHTEIAKFAAQHDGSQSGPAQV